jgi:hypothetical protein
MRATRDTRKQKSETIHVRPTKKDNKRPATTINDTDEQQHVIQENKKLKQSVPGQQGKTTNSADR